MGARPAKQAGSEIQRTFDAVHSAREHVVTQPGGGGVEDVAGKLPWARSQPSGSGVDDEGVARAGFERIAVRCRSAARAGKMDLVPRESLSTTDHRCAVRPLWARSGEKGSRALHALPDAPDAREEKLA